MEEKKNYVLPIIMGIIIAIVFILLVLKVVSLQDELENSQPKQIYIVEPNEPPPNEPPPITAHVFPANDTWKKAYGDSDNTAIFFNLKILQELIKNTNARIKALEDPNGR